LGIDKISDRFADPTSKASSPDLDVHPSQSKLA